MTPDGGALVRGIPDDLRRAVQYDLGATRARRWLDGLPAVIDGFAERWSLQLDEMLGGGRLSACVAGRDADGRPVVLKVPTSVPTGRRELLALRLWAGGPVPTVRRHDARSGVFAMERITPGTELAQTGSAADAAMVAPVLWALHRHRNVGGRELDRFPRLEAVLAVRLRWAAQRCALPENTVGRTLHARAAALLERPYRFRVPRPALLHGDFQTKNLLVGGGGSPHAIDPLPCLGDTAFDAATWCVLQSSPVPVEARVDQIARELGLDAGRIADWALLVGTLEYRPYRPDQAARIRTFVG
ncbi:MAG: aminoglycoside phosphotransferase family protein [Gaiellales bacterium]